MGTRNRGARVLLGLGWLVLAGTVVGYGAIRGHLGRSDASSVASLGVPLAGILLAAAFAAALRSAGEAREKPAPRAGVFPALAGLAALGLFCGGLWVEGRLRQGEDRKIASDAVDLARRRLESTRDGPVFERLGGFKGLREGEVARPDYLWLLVDRLEIDARGEFAKENIGMRIYVVAGPQSAVDRVEFGPLGPNGPEGLLVWTTHPMFRP
ncbi:MAG: hypothetical protein HYY18_07710 [Planctomycetes bacterium]|nr:hypothetical protein [Planctomycetota bacterium]